MNEFVVGSLLDSMLSDLIPTDIVVPPVSTRGVLNCDDAAYLKQLYQNLKPESGPTTINSIYVRYMSVTIRGRKFGSSKSNSFIAMAEWDDSVFGAQPTPPPDSLHPSARFRPVRITHYIRITFCVGENGQDHLLLVVVAWFCHIH